MTVLDYSLQTIDTTTVFVTVASESSSTDGDAALDEYLGKSISEICPNEYTDNSKNHCAHFVSHVKGYTFGFKCYGMTNKGPKPGASIRVHEVFSECPLVGRWDDKPESITSCLAFVTSSKNVKVDKKEMLNVPAKHIGIFSGGMIYHYSNSKDQVVKQTPQQFKKHYKGSTIEVFYGTFPTV